jgi:CDP-paratose 2-epimerase
VKTVLVTGSSGLIGSEAVAYFDDRGARVHGVDNNMRMDFFGPGGDTRWNLERLRSITKSFQHHAVDIRDRGAVLRLFAELAPDLVIHCAAQPSHDLARERPLDDFDVNAVGTVNLLEAMRRHAPESVFCFMSTNKVYGDTPNRLPLRELATRWDYERAEDFHGIAETCSIDQSQHSIFGASKVAADVMVQEYARCYGLKTGVFRGGCLTGPAHSGVELHGFLNYFVKVAKSGSRYRIFGYKGKQVRDQIHSFDVIRALDEFSRNPRPGEVYNLGGGRENSCSILECIEAVKAFTGKSLDYEYLDENRRGDHICYISDLRKLKRHYPNWNLTKTLQDIWQDLLRA